MKKITLFSVLVLCVLGLSAQNSANFAEEAPITGTNGSQNSSAALWDLLHEHNITDSANTAGLAGVIYFDDLYWVSQWASDSIFRFDSTGAFFDKFVIAGLSGTRSFTSGNGVLFAGNATNTLYEIDHTNLTLIGGFPISSNVTARYAAFDPTLDGGLGGFWVGNFSTDIESVSMSGALLSTIPAATVNTAGRYGATVDAVSPGGPYLWLFAQDGTNNSEIVQLQLPSGVPTGLSHDAFPDITTDSIVTSIAGGIHFTQDRVFGKNTLVCLAQGNPKNLIMVYEVGSNNASVSETNLTDLVAYPNPTNGVISLNLASWTPEHTYNVTDVTGKSLLTGTFNKDIMELDIESFPAGTYFVSVYNNDELLNATSIVKQ